MAGDSCVDKFAAALRLLERGEKQEFLVATRMLITVLHNLCKNPQSEKYRKLKTTSEIIQQILAIPYTHDCLVACDFVKYDKYYRIDGDVNARELADCMNLLVEARKRKDVMEAWEVFPSDLELGDKIGSGKFGAVFEGLWSGHKVAIKTMKRNTDDGMRDFEREADVMRKLKHPNVLNLLGVVLTQQPALIVLELMGASFLSLLAKCELTDKDILDCAMQVAAGLEYVHHRGYLHCDIACRNVLVSPSGVLKISDFGLARKIGSEECNLKGTKAKFPIRWTAPEVFVQQKLSAGSDVWSFGILFWEVVTLGDIPYSSLTNKEAKKAVKRGHFPEKPPNCRKEFYQVMKQCWTQDVEERPAFTDIVQELLSLKIKLAHQQVNTNAVKEIRIKRKATKPKFTWPHRRKSTLSEVPAIEPPAVGDCITGPDASVPGLIRIKTLLISHDKMHVVLKASYSTKASKLIAAALKKTGIDETTADNYCLVEAGHNGVYQRVLDSEEYPLSLTASPFYSSMQDIYICRYDQAINIHASIRQRQAHEEESYLDAVERTQQQQQQQQQQKKQQQQAKTLVDMAGIGDDDDDEEEEAEAAKGASSKRTAGEAAEDDDDDFDMEKQPWFKRKKSDFGRCTVKVALKSAVYEGTGARGSGNKDAPGLSEALYEDHAGGDENEGEEDKQCRRGDRAQTASGSEAAAASAGGGAEVGDARDCDAGRETHGTASVNNVRQHLTKMMQSDQVPGQRPKPRPRPRRNRRASGQDEGSHAEEYGVRTHNSDHDSARQTQEQEHTQHQVLRNTQPQNTTVRQAAPPEPVMRSKKNHDHHHRRARHDQHGSGGEHVSVSKRASEATSLGSNSPITSAVTSARSSRDFSDTGSTGGRRKAANVKTMTEAWRMRTPQGSRHSVGEDPHVGARRVPLPVQGSKLRLFHDSAEESETDADDLQARAPRSAASSSSSLLDGQNRRREHGHGTGKKKRRPAPPPPPHADRHTGATSTDHNDHISNSTSRGRRAGKHVPPPLSTLQPLSSQAGATTPPKALVSPALTTVSTSSASSASSSGRSAETRSRSSSRSSRRRSTLVTIREDQQLALSEPNVEHSLAALHRRCSQESYSPSHSGGPLSPAPSSPRSGTRRRGRRGSVSENGSILDLRKGSSSSRESSVSRSGTSSVTSSERPKRSGLDDLDRLNLLMMTLEDDDDDDDDDDNGTREVRVGRETSTDSPLEGEVASGSETPTHATKCDDCDDYDDYDDDGQGYTPQLTTKGSQRIARDMQCRSHLSEDTDLDNDAYIEVSTSSNANGIEGRTETQRNRPLVIGKGNPELAL